VFLVVITITVVLIIFFGAWAVTADAEGRELTFALTGSALEDPDSPSTGGDAQGQNAFGVAPIGETSDSASGTWWGQGFLKACPLH
jgi:hypothetical protein